MNKNIMGWGLIIRVSIYLAFEPTPLIDSLEILTSFLLERNNGHYILNFEP